MEIIFISKDYIENEKLYISKIKQKKLILFCKYKCLYFYHNSNIKNPNKVMKIIKDLFKENDQNVINLKF